MAIRDFESHGKHIAYTMTLAVAGFAYVSASYDDGNTLFAIGPLGGVLPAIIVAFALVSFLLAIAFGIFAMFGMSGLNQLTAAREDHRSTIQDEKLQREMAGVALPTDEEKQAAASLKEVSAKIPAFSAALLKNSNRHLTWLFAAFIFSAILFVDAKFDPNPSPPNCVISVNADGVLVLPVTCVPASE